MPARWDLSGAHELPQGFLAASELPQDLAAVSAALGLASDFWHFFCDIGKREQPWL